MKKKIFLTMLIVSIFACLFAVAVSAADIPEWTEITEVSGMPDKSVFGTDGTSGATSRVLMSDGKTYPAYYICKNSTSLGFSFTDLNNKTAGGYSAEKVVRIEIPKGTITVSDAMKVANGFTSLLTIDIPEGVTTISQYGIKTSNTETDSPVVRITLPSTLTSIGSQAFYGCNSLEELIIPKGVTEIPLEMAYYATSLKKLVLPSTIQSIGQSAFRSADLSETDLVIPEGCTSIGNYAFKGSNVKTATTPSTLTTIGIEIFRDCNNLTKVHFKSSTISDYMCYECFSLETVILENTTSIGKYAFTVESGKVSALKTLILPEGLVSIKDCAFARSQLTSFILPSTVTTFSQGTFKESKTLEKVTILGSVTATDMFSGCTNLKILVITENYKTFGENTLKDAKTSFITFYTGTDYDRIRTLITSSRVKNAKNCTYDDYVKGNYTSNNLLVYGANLCEVSYDSNHTESELQNYQTKCTRCGLIVYCEMPGHTLNTTIVYSSFSENGAKTVKCVDCNTAGRKTTALPLYISLGYSVSEDGGVTTGFRVNYDAIIEYENATGENLNYGLFVAVYDRIGEKDIINLETGKTNENAIALEVSNREFSILNIKINGFETPEQKSASFSFGMFVVATKDETKKLVYLQHDAPVDGSKYSYITYNSLIG